MTGERLPDDVLTDFPAVRETFETARQVVDMLRSDPQNLKGGNTAFVQGGLIAFSDNAILLLQAALTFASAEMDSVRDLKRRVGDLYVVVRVLVGVLEREGKLSDAAKKTLEELLESVVKDTD